jgi:hypothetical protein
LHDGAPESLLDTYEEERKPIALEVLQRTSAATNILFAMNPVARFVREQVLVPILRTPFVQRRVFAKLSQLEMNYRGRSLSTNFGGMFSRVRVRAGDRTPDVVFGKNGEKVSLFQLIGGCGMIALLGRRESNPEISGALGALCIRSFIVFPEGAEKQSTESLEDIHGDFARLYGARGPFLYLIRPDGHVALFQRGAEAKELARYLKKIRASESVEKSFAL